MHTQRYFVFSALMETAFAHIIMDRYSTRTAMKLDNYARIALPLCYTIMMTYLRMFAPKSEEAVEELKLMQNLVYASLAILYVLGAAWAVYSYNRLMHLMRKKPIEVHKSSSVHLDKNELHKLFNFIDIDGGKSLDMSEIVIMMLGLEDIATEYSSGKVAKAESVTVSREDCPEKVLQMIAILEKKFGAALNKESFNAHHRAIFAEVDIFLTQNPELEKLWAEHTARVRDSIVRAEEEPKVKQEQLHGTVPVIV
jgi:hypothetical protein